MADERTGGSNKGLWILVVVIVAVVCFFAGRMFSSAPGADSKNLGALANVHVDSDFLPVGSSPVKGEGSAALTAVVFVDYQNDQTPILNRTMDKALKEHGNAMRLVVKHMPSASSPDAMNAAKAAMAANAQGKFWEYHNKLIASFPKKGKGGDEAAYNENFAKFLTEENLVSYASALKLNVEKFKADMQSAEVDSAVRNDLALAEKLAISQSPALFVNGLQIALSGKNEKDVQKEIASEMGKARKIGAVKNANYMMTVLINQQLKDGSAVAAEAAEAAAPVALGIKREAGPFADKPESEIKFNGGLKATEGGPDITKLPMRGNPNAKVTIVEFSDYQCPFCKRAEPTIDQVIVKFPNDVRVFFANFPLSFHSNAGIAALASWAAARQGNAKFWAMHKMMFDNNQALARADLIKYAEKSGLNMEQFHIDINSKDASDAVNQQMSDAQAFGIGGTPSFLINGELLVGAQPLEAFVAQIEKSLARAKQVAADKNLSGNELYAELVKTAPKPAPEPEEPEEDLSRKYVAIEDSPVHGPENAVVTIVEFTDFECPFCSRANNTVNELMKNNEGKIRLVFRHYPLPFHKNAQLAHRAAEAAKMQGKFWPYYELLFANQRSLSKEDLIAYAEKAGLNVEKFKTDLDNEELDKRVQSDLRLGNTVGVNGTPHFLINGKPLSGARPLADFQKAVDDEIAFAKFFQDAGLSGNDLYEAIAKSDEGKKDEPVPAPDPAPAPVLEVNIDGSPFKGVADAPVTIIQFSDFECPFCSRVEPTIDQLMSNYEGKIKVVFKQFPLGFHQNAKPAAEASLAAHAQGKFWEMHKILFENSSNLSRESMIAFASQIGLDVEKFKEDLNSGKFSAVVDKDATDGSKVGISGTPSFVINGELLVGAQPYDAFKQVIDRKLAQ